MANRNRSRDLIARKMAGKRHAFPSHCSLRLMSTPGLTIGREADTFRVWRFWPESVCTGFYDATGPNGHRLKREV